MNARRLDAVAPVVIPTIAFLMRLALGLHHSMPWASGGDSAAYVHMAKELFGREPGLMVTHPPLYPIFLFFVYVLPDEHLWPALVAQAILGALTSWCALRFSRELLPPSAGVAAALIVALDPFLVQMSTVFLSETLFTTLLIAGLWRWCRAWRSESAKEAIAGGILLSLAALTRSVLGPFLPLFTAAFLWKRSRVSLILGFALSVALPILIWCSVLHAKTGHWIPISTQKGWNIYEGMNPNFDDPEAIVRWQNAMGEETTRLGTDDPVRQDQYFFEKAKREARSHPADTAKLMVRKFFKFWHLWPYFPYSKTQRIISAIFMTPLLLGAFLGATELVRTRSYAASTTFLLIGFIALYALLNTITWTQIRYRVPIHPVLALLAGYWLDRRLQPSRELHAN